MVPGLRTECRDHAARRDLYGENNHHIAETCYKALARALRKAVEIDPRQGGRVPSTKGSLSLPAARALKGRLRLVDYTVYEPRDPPADPIERAAGLVFLKDGFISAPHFSAASG